jgi:hypothetical protein
VSYNGEKLSTLQQELAQMAAAKIKEVYGVYLTDKEATEVIRAVCSYAKTLPEISTEIENEEKKGKEIRGYQYQS